MLANVIYYVDIITYVFKICLFHPHNAQEHSAFCPQIKSSVLHSMHENMCSFQYLMDTMLICWCFFLDKRRSQLIYAFRNTEGILSTEKVLRHLAPHRRRDGLIRVLRSSGSFWVWSLRKLHCWQKKQSLLFVGTSYDSLLVINAAAHLH